MERGVHLNDLEGKAGVINKLSNISLLHVYTASSLSHIASMIMFCILSLKFLQNAHI